MLNFKMKIRYFCVDRRGITSAFQPANHSASWTYYLIAEIDPVIVWVSSSGIHCLVSHAWAGKRQKENRIWPMVPLTL